MDKEQMLKEKIKETEEISFKLILEYAKMQEINKRNCLLSIILLMGIAANIISAILYFV